MKIGESVVVVLPGALRDSTFSGRTHGTIRHGYATLWAILQPWGQDSQLQGGHMSGLAYRYLTEYLQELDEGLFEGLSADERAREEQDLKTAEEFEKGLLTSFESFSDESWKRFRDAVGRNRDFLNGVLEDLYARDMLKKYPRWL